jgi:hypothetical protein
MKGDDYFQKVIDYTRKSFGDPPRKFGFIRTRYHTIRPPKWAKAHNDIRFLELYQKQDVLFREGILVWGYIIQANQLLFESGRHDHPAALIYSLDQAIDGSPDSRSGYGIVFYQRRPDGPRTSGLCGQTRG